MESLIRGLLLFLHGFLGVSAIGAGFAMVADPSGAGLGFETEWLDGSPFGDYLIPGLFLGIVISSANLASFYLQWRRQESAAMASFLTGAMLIAWVVIQTAIIGYFHWSQIIWFVSFPLVALLGAVQLRGIEGHRRSAETQ